MSVRKTTVRKTAIRLGLALFMGVLAVGSAAFVIYGVAGMQLALMGLPEQQITEVINTLLLTHALRAGVITTILAFIVFTWLGIPGE